MNSQQRRKHHRAYQHEVILRPITTQHWFEHDERVILAKLWCRRKFKGRYWTETVLDNAVFEQTVFRFTREQDAVLFALKWA